MVILMKSPDEVKRNFNVVSKKPGFVKHNYILFGFLNKPDESIHQWYIQYKSLEIHFCPFFFFFGNILFMSKVV